MRLNREHFSLVTPSKRELWWSLITTLVGLWNVGTVPHGYVNGLTACGAFLVGFFCVLNAARDFKHVKWWERGGTAILLCFLIYITPLTLWYTATATSYADR